MEKARITVQSILSKKDDVSMMERTMAIPGIMTDDDDEQQRSRRAATPLVLKK